ncbi:uncharacterized protein LOC129594364 isoform X2 [Paramacrobiotus metropolitanus]|uniref:uncharacterized protein LOC129594364 isoform X2 n=1 Tax=Paramacrobiotus metropolitanus TaxID=2943436 RepID=UPI002445AD7B|nr:uncharacterized protein LOC129594364 isoform X2 [Paramacrobiotus metropolitanus]
MYSLTMPGSRALSRQLAPTFIQSAGYQFSNVNCIPNQPVGRISAYSESAGDIAYTVDSETGSSVTVNINSGLILMATVSYDVQHLTFRATNQHGSRTVPVTIYCSGNSVTGKTMVPTFSMASYIFTVTNCYTGYYNTNANVGAVYANGASYYTLSAGNGNSPGATFNINPSGLITMNGYASTGYYTLAVTAYGSNGLTSSTTVAVYLSCNGNANPISANPVFQQASYSFASAPAGSDSCINEGTIIGNVFAFNAHSYAVTSEPSGLFTISHSGQISLSTATTGALGGHYSITVTAYGSNAGSASVPVTISIPSLRCAQKSTGTATAVI